MELYLYDIESGEAQRRWTLAPARLAGIIDKREIEVQDSSKYPDCGIFAVGEYRWWLYSKALFPDPDRLRSELTALAAAAVRWGQSE
jgi:hypothetical protein